MFDTNSYPNRFYFGLFLYFQDNVFSLDNRTCAQVIYDNYILSYSADISEAVDVKIWDSSRCDCE